MTHPPMKDSCPAADQVATIVLISSHPLSLLLWEVKVDQAHRAAPPASNSAGSVQPHPPRPPAEWSRSDGDWNWEASSGQKVPAAPVSNSGGSFPPHWNWEASSGQKVPAAPVSNSEADDLENWGSKWKPTSHSAGENTAKHNSNCQGLQNLMVLIDKVIQRANRDRKLSAADLIGFFWPTCNGPEPISCPSRDCDSFDRECWTVLEARGMSC